MFLRFDRTTTLEGRNRIPLNSELCTVVVSGLDKPLAAGAQKGKVTWTPVVTTMNDTTSKRRKLETTPTKRVPFELPVTRYSRTTNGRGPWQDHGHPRYAYAYGAYAYGASYYDAWGLLKIDCETGRAITFRERDSCYYSEPCFVADPDGLGEDRGVLLCQRYDGRQGTTSLLVINAATMEKVAEANTGVRVPMDFHGAFFPAQ